MQLPTFFPRWVKQYAEARGVLRLSADSQSAQFETLDVSDLPTAIPATNIATGVVSNTEFEYLNGLTVALSALVPLTVAGVTASTTQTQGQGAIAVGNGEYFVTHQVSVCANVNDTVTLPAAIAGRVVTVINDGAQTLRVYPASGDDVGGGVNTATTIVAGSVKVFRAFDTTNWQAI